mgnify:FL=1
MTLNLAHLPGRCVECLRDTDCGTGGTCVNPGVCEIGDDRGPEPDPGTDPGKNPGNGDEPGDEPGDQPSDQPVTFTVGTPTMNGQPNGVTTGDQVTFSVPVTNTGEVPITQVNGQSSGPGGNKPMQCTQSIQPGAKGTCTITMPAASGTNQVSFNITVISENGTQMARACSATYTAKADGAGDVAASGDVEVNGQRVTKGTSFRLTSTNPATLKTTVTNKGNAPITNLSAQSPSGNVRWSC